MTEQQQLRVVLAELRFPAERWQIITSADLWGADAATCERLRMLPQRAAPYRDIQDVVDALNKAAPAPKPQPNEPEPRSLRR